MQVAVNDLRRRRATAAAAWALSLLAHALVLVWWVMPVARRGEAGGAEPVLTVRLLPSQAQAPTVPGVPATTRQSGPPAQAPLTAARSGVVPSPAAKPPSASRPAEPAPEPAPAPTELAKVARAGELTHLPRLPGEPVIDLRDVPHDLDASLWLRLVIDERGKVVHDSVESVQGMPAELVNRLRNAFVGYPYVPGDIDGVPVRSEVVMHLRVREGLATVGGAP
jgi:hypothetical protein